MSIALVQQKTAVVTVAGTSHAVTFDAATAAGNFLCVVLFTSGGSTANATAAGGGGNTWTELHDLGVSGQSNTHTAIYYVANAAATTTVTVTTSSGQTSQLIAFELSGAATSSGISVSSIAAETATATSHASPSVTPGQAGCFVFGALAVSGSLNPTLSGTAYTALSAPTANGSLHGRIAYRIPNTATTEAVTWTGTSSTRGVVATVAVKPATFTPPAPATAIVQQKTAVTTVSGTSHTVTFDTATTAGRFLWLAFAGSAGSTGNVTGVTGGGNTWTELHDLGATSQANSELAIYYVANAASTTTITVTTSGGQTAQLIAGEVSGAATASPIDGSSIVADAVAANIHTSPSVTPTQVGAMVLGFLNCSGTLDPALVGSTYTALSTPTTNGSIHGRGAYRVAPFLTAEAVSWSGSSSTRGVTATVVVKPAVAGTAADPVVDQWWVGTNRIRFRVQGSTAATRVGFSTVSSMTSPVYSASVTPDAQGIAIHTLPALTANTVYYYRAEVAGVLRGTVQSFRTLPGTAAASFKFGFASCRDDAADVPSRNPTALVDAMSRDISLFIEHGDFNYTNTNSATASTYYPVYDEYFTRPNIAALLAGVPTAYVWDDHDFCGDNSDGTSTGRDAARSVYKARVPSPTMPGAGIYHTFRVGRVRFIMLDSRSYRSPSANVDDANKTMLGAEQKSWLQGLLAFADTPLTFIVSPVSWTAATAGSDHWGQYSTERAVIGGWITAAATRVVFLCGDAHCMAFDNGTNSVAGVHTWQAAALNQTTGVKGGPYSGGTFAGSNQYGFVQVTDTGTSISATFSGIKSDTTVWNTDTVTAGPSALPAVSGKTVSGLWRNTAGTATSVVVAGRARANPVALIETVDPTRAEFGLHDSAGHTMDTLQVVKHPTAAGYIGVYHWFDGTTFNVGASTSTDLRTWTFQRQLVADASQGYLAFTPGTNIPVLAVETNTSNHLRFLRWATVADMLGTTAAAGTFDAARLLSSFAEGTPAIESIVFDSPTSTLTTGSTITVSHHYFEDGIVDREARGTLRNFQTWNTAIDTAVTTALLGAGASGKHGDRDVFVLDGVTYTLFEGSVNPTTAEFDMGDWRNYLWNGSLMRALNVQTPGGSVSIANPSITIGPDPNGVQSAIIGQFIPSEGAASGESGQLLYWNPL